MKFTKPIEAVQIDRHIVGVGIVDLTKAVLEGIS
jgi:hypothetical protein